MKVANAVLPSMELSAKAAIDALRSIMELRSDLLSERQTPK